MASLFAIYGDKGLYKKSIEVVSMTSVDDIEAALTTKNKNSCLEALHYNHLVIFCL